jgi:hypothetical protein
MDSQISLALMAKAKLVFERDDTFLAFPITPLTYDKAQLNFASDDAGQNVRRLLEFSQLVDRIPQGTIWSSWDDRSLSDVYVDILSAAKLAESNRTAGEETAYQEAWKFLHTDDADGLPHDTPISLAYQSSRDVYFLALENYKNRQLTAESSTDLAAKTQWTTIDEPLLREKRDTAFDRWSSDGRKDAVEHAKNVLSNLSAKSVSLTWSQWKSRCNPDLDFQTDHDSNKTFAPSGFSPANALDSGSWQRFTLAGREVDALAHNAPAELRSLLGDTVDLDVESVSFEYSSAGIQRTWFVSDVFRSRFWKLGDARVISDGKQPPKGLCPAYIAGVVFARNLDIKPRAGAPRNEVAGRRFAAGELLNVASFGLARPLGFSEVGAASRPVLATIVQQVPPTPKITSAPIASIGTAKRPVAAKQMAATSRTFSASEAATQALLHSTGFIVAAQPKVAAAPSPSVVPNRSVVRMQKNFDRVPLSTNPEPQPSSKAPSGSGDDHITILAVICKPLGLCPDPDPALRW